MTKQVIKGDDGKEYVLNEKKPFTKRPWFWIAIILFILIIGAGLSYSVYQKHQAAVRAATLKAKTDRFNDEEKNFSDYTYKI